jgi:hypothetical protein
VVLCERAEPHPDLILDGFEYAPFSRACIPAVKSAFPVKNKKLALYDYLKAYEPCIFLDWDVLHAKSLLERFPAASRPMTFAGHETVDELNSGIFMVRRMMFSTDDLLGLWKRNGLRVGGHGTDQALVDQLLSEIRYPAKDEKNFGRDVNAYWKQARAFDFSGGAFSAVNRDAEDCVNMHLWGTGRLPDDIMDLVDRIAASA